MAQDLDELLRRVDALPQGVQKEVRDALRACLDVVGPGLVRILELAAASDALDPIIHDPLVTPLLELCGLDRSPEPDVSVSPVSVSPRPTCEVCGAPIGSAHDHAADVDHRRLLCVCRPCHLGLSATGRYRALPDRIERIADLDQAPDWWLELQLPVELVFFIRAASTGALTAFFPGAAGVVESTVEIDDLPVALSDDVEALLVRNTARFEAWTVPVDRCYELAGLLKHRSVGSPTIAATAQFFDSLLVP